MAGRAVARAAVGDLAGLRFRLRDEILQRARGMGLVHHQHLRDAAHQGDAGEIAARIVARRLHHAGHARESDGDRKQRVAVGRRALHVLRADDGALSRTVLDDDLLAQALRRAPRRPRAPRCPGCRRERAARSCATGFAGKRLREGICRHERQNSQDGAFHSFSSFTWRARRAHSAARKREVGAGGNVACAELHESGDQVGPRREAADADMLAAAAAGGDHALIGLREPSDGRIVRRGRGRRGDRSIRSSPCRCRRSRRSPRSHRATPPTRTAP